MSTKRKAPSRPGNMKTGKFQGEAERDSGFSDASSEHLSTMDTTDSEDSPGPVHSGSNGSSSKPGPRLTVLGGSYSSLSPMIIMNNVVLKQPADPPPALKPWRFSPAVDVVQPVVQQPQVVFLQPVVSQKTSSTPKMSSKHRRAKKYLPILKSYPKIAPRDSSSSSSSSNSSSSSSSSSSRSSSSGRGTLSSISSGSSATSNSSSQNTENPHRSSASSVQNAPSNLPLTLSAISPQLQNQLLPSLKLSKNKLSQDDLNNVVKSSELATTQSLAFNPKKKSLQTLLSDSEPAQAAQQDGDGDGDDDGDSDVRRKRFCNTYNILSQSGLLDITLRTKELLRQNKRTQTDIQRLKEHTDLFLQALRSGDTSICVKLQATLREEDKEQEKEGKEVKAD